MGFGRSAMIVISSLGLIGSSASYVRLSSIDGSPIIENGIVVGHWSVNASSMGLILSIAVASFIVLMLSIAWPYITREDKPRQMYQPLPHTYVAPISNSHTFCGNCGLKKESWYNNCPRCGQEFRRAQKIRVDDHKNNEF
jgi:hypothetical protein